MAEARIRDGYGVGLRRDLGSFQSYAALVGILVGAGGEQAPVHRMTVCIDGSETVINRHARAIDRMATRIEVVGAMPVAPLARLHERQRQQRLPNPVTICT